MNSRDKDDSSTNVLKKITEALPDTFGEPLKGALRTIFTDADEDSICASAIIGMLYLSHRLTKFPQTKLRTYCCNLRQEFSPLPLDCRHYDDICRSIEGGMPTTGILIDNELSAQEIKIEKEHILEALDFISNG